MELSVIYGNGDEKLNITDYVFEYCVKDGKIKIPKDDNLRAGIFGDPCYGKYKYITVIHKDKEDVFFWDMDVDFDVSKYVENSKKEFPYTLLTNIHEDLKFEGGSLNSEYPEQLLAVEYISKDACVLELGANIGRNSCVISSILEKSSNLLTLECDPNTAKTLENNRDLNNLKFHIESSALSKRKLLQKGWETIPSDEPKVGWVEIQTIQWEDLLEKYNFLNFDTLVVDCEGALYWILKDFPNILDNFNLVIVENDYKDYKHKESVDEKFVKNGLKCVKSIPGRWPFHLGECPCKKEFYQVWKR